MKLFATIAAPVNAVVGSLASVGTAFEMLNQYAEDAAAKQQANRVNVLAEQANDIAATALDIRKQSDKLADAIDAYDADRALAKAQARVKRATTLAKAASANINADIAELKIDAMNGMPQTEVAKRFAAIQARKATYDKLMAMTLQTTFTTVEEEESAESDMDAAAQWLSSNPL